MAKNRIATKKRESLDRSSIQTSLSSPMSNRRSSPMSGRTTSPTTGRRSLQKTVQNNSRSKSKSLHAKGKKNSKTTPKKKIKRKPRQMIVGNKIFKISDTIFREIKKLQTSTETLIPRAAFSRLIREILFQRLPSDGRIQQAALEALQESAEAYVVQFFEDSYCCALHARRCTLLPRDMGLIQHLQRNH